MEVEFNLVMILAYTLCPNSPRLLPILLRLCNMGRNLGIFLSIGFCRLKCLCNVTAEPISPRS